MKNKVRFKIIINSSITKAILVLLIIASLFLAVLLPSILLRSPRGSVTTYNRDSASGTRQAFAEYVLEDKEFTPGYNVREVTNNDSMIRAVSKNNDSIGYVSLGTVANFDDKGDVVISDAYKDTISFVSFQSSETNDGDIITPTLGTISSGDYQPSRNFNMFFRVKQGTPEAKILSYDWSQENENQNMSQNEIQSLDPDLLMSYLFMNWSLNSKEARNMMEENGEIPAPSESVWEDTVDIINNYVLYTGLDKQSQTTIEIVGSSSASSIIKEMSELFEETMKQHGFDVKFMISTNGSGDAFKETIPGTNNPYIGIQSRSPNDSEFESWGWGNGESIDNSLYKAFAIDAILIIYNLETNDPESTIDLSNDNLYTSSSLMYELYTTDEYIFYDEIFKIIEVNT